jgi:DNA-binding CsgD family transcriptional regulator/tetratricopeptide (TPR) repeat protein
MVDSSPVFIARSSELELLDAALVRATAREPSLVVIGGEAGIGKTRLLEELESRVRDRALVVIGRCVPAYGHGVPYAPFADLFRDLERQLERDQLATVLGPARPALGLVVPELGPPTERIHLGVAETRMVSRFRLFETILGIAERLQAVGPVVIAIEDLHWADEATLGLLGFLVREVREGRLLLVVTVRTDDLQTGNPVARAIGDLERTRRVERIELAPFSRSELTDQLAAILGAPPDHGLVDRVLARSDGNPFFAEELLAAERRGEAVALSPRLEDLLRARLGTVTDHARAVLRVAAAIGPEIDDELVAHAAEIPIADVATALREATEHGLLVRGERPPVRYAFRHRLLQEGIDRELLPGERRRLHAKVAEALEQSAQGEFVAGEIARHWLMAERPDRALPPAVTAGIVAERRFAFEDAWRSFELAFRISQTGALPTWTSNLDRVDLLQHAADAAVLAGDAGAAVGLARLALDELGRGSDPPREASIHERLRWYLWESGDHDGAEAALAEAQRVVPVDPPSATRARILGQLGGLRLRQGRFAESLGHAEEAIVVARATGALAELAFALGVRGWDRTAFGRADEGIADLREGLAIAEFLERPEGQALGIANLSSLLLYAARLDEAIRTAVDGLASVRAIGLERTYGGTLAATAAAAAYLLGRWTEARDLCGRAMELAFPGPSAVWPGAVTMRLASGSGDEALMRAGLAMAAPCVAAATERLHEAWFWLATIEGELAADQLETAQGHAAAAIDRLPAGVLDEPTGSLFILAMTIAAERAETARAAADEPLAVAQRALAGGLVDEWRRRRSAPGTAVPNQEVADALDALFVAQVGRAEGASNPASWERAAGALERLGLVYPGAYARLRQAEAIIRAAAPHSPQAARDARAAAAGPLRVALDAGWTLGSRPIVAAAVLLARRARLDAALVTDRAAIPEATREPAPATGPAAAFVARRHLTPREVEVLTLIGSGWSNGEIASALYISRKTASVHVSNILGKLGAADRVEAGALANRAGLVGPPRPGSVLPELELDERSGSRSV